VNEELEMRMISAYEAVRDRAGADALSLRDAAYAIAVERVARAIRLRGFV
jgi:glutamate dehydrogenase (NAD(P)+)